jgi:hypothetical protein
MTISDTQRQFQALSDFVGEPIDLSQGAIRINLGEYGPWWMELDPSGSMLTVHHTLAQFESGDAVHWLALNTDLKRLGGAWIGLHTPTSTVRLILLLELSRFDGIDLVNVITNMMDIRANLPMSETRQSQRSEDLSTFIAA